MSDVDERAAAMAERLARRWQENPEEHMQANSYGLVDYCSPEDATAQARWWLAAIVEELGITSEDVDLLRRNFDLSDDEWATADERAARLLADALDTLLRAARPTSGEGTDGP
jgi:hypothetical protein